MHNVSWLHSLTVYQKGLLRAEQNSNISKYNKHDTSGALYTMHGLKLNVKKAPDMPYLFYLEALQVNFRLNIPYFPTIWTVLVVYWFVLIKCFQFSWDLATLKSFFEKQGIRSNPLYRIEPN